LFFLLSTLLQAPSLSLRSAARLLRDAAPYAAAAPLVSDAVVAFAEHADDIFRRGHHLALPFEVFHALLASAADVAPATHATATAAAAATAALSQTSSSSSSLSGLGAGGPPGLARAGSLLTATAAARSTAGSPLPGLCASEPVVAEAIWAWILANRATRRQVRPFHSLKINTAIYL